MAAAPKPALPEMFEDETDAGNRVWEDTQTQPARTKRGRGKRKPTVKDDAAKAAAAEEP